MKSATSSENINSLEHETIGTVNPMLTIGISQATKFEHSATSEDSTYFSHLIEALGTEKLDTDKIKTLILIEKEALLLKDKKKLFSFFQILTNFLNDTDCLNSNIFKGQILMTATTVLILTNCKEEVPQIFLSFINNILVEHLKNTNNYSNIYLRQICCQCLEELENEYPGLLFNLMGQKAIDTILNKTPSPILTTSNESKTLLSSKGKPIINIPVPNKKIKLESKIFLLTLRRGTSSADRRRAILRLSKLLKFVRYNCSAYALLCKCIFIEELVHFYQKVFEYFRRFIH